MKCAYAGCNEPVVEVSGALGVGLCRTHLHAEVPQPLERKPVGFLRALNCAECGEPTNQLSVPGQPDPEVFHAHCQAKRATTKPNKSLTPPENK